MGFRKKSNFPSFFNKALDGIGSHKLAFAYLTCLQPVSAFVKYVLVCLEDLSAYVSRHMKAYLYRPFLIFGPFFKPSRIRTVRTTLTTQTACNCWTSGMGNAKMPVQMTTTSLGAWETFQEKSTSNAATVSAPTWKPKESIASVDCC